MSTAPFIPADPARLARLLLDMSQERSVERVLKLIVDQIAAQPAIALARIWLIGPGDLCEKCRFLKDCPDQSECLHLIASAGKSIETGQEWINIDGDFRRIPIGKFKIGRIAATRDVCALSDIDENPERLAHPDWAKLEGIRAFGGQPLIHQDERLGVLGVFARSRLDQENLTWMRVIADHAAAAIANARAFEEIAALKQRLELERDYLRDELLQVHSFGDILGKSSSLQSVLQQIELVAPTDASVLILGESGTGKELIAREIHHRSVRKDRPLVKVNCASIPRELYESEFFGHVKGAFTGAVTDRSGRFQLADEGTLFLDEIGEIPLDMQSKLLRVLQEGEFERVGEEQTRQVDVRIIAATNRNLKEETAARRFREDLYYRLNVFPIQITPLRERTEDIPILSAHFVAMTAGKLNRPVPRLTQRNIRDLQRYHWPGNIRELQNVLERAVITSKTGRLRFDLPTDRNQVVPDEVSAGHDSEASEILTDDEVRQIERDNIVGPRSSVSTPKMEKTFMSNEPDSNGPIMAALERLQDQVDYLIDEVSTVSQMLDEHLGTKDWYTTAEVAAMIGKTQHTVQERYCNAGRIECEKDQATGKWRIPGHEYDRLRRGGRPDFH